MIQILLKCYPGIQITTGQHLYRWWPGGTRQTIWTSEGKVQYYNMTAWTFGAKLWWLPLTAGCVKLQIPASSSRVRHNGERVQADWRQYRYGSLWLYLNLQLIHLENTHLYVSGDWWFHINYSNIDKSLFLHKLATQSYVPDDVTRALRPFTTGCVKLQLPLLRRDTCRHNRGK